MWQAGALRIGRIGGVAVDVHLTFGLVIAWAAWQGWTLTGGLAGALISTGLILLLFACVLLHELGHALQARVFGLAVRHILLLPVGGVAELETARFDPWQELLFTLAGPFVNLVLALIFGIAAFSVAPFSLVDWPEHLALAGQVDAADVLRYLFWVNASLFLFNMVPAFPIDGGRILRAAIALRAGYDLATQVAVGLGYAFAAGLALLGVLGMPPLHIEPAPLLILVAAVTALGARYEEIYLRRQRALLSLRAGDVAASPRHSVQPWDRLTRTLAADLLQHEHTLPLSVDRLIVGLLTYHEVRRAARTFKEGASVAHFMRTDFPIVQAHDTLWGAVSVMESAELSLVPVIEGDEFRGVISLDDIRRSWRTRRRGSAGAKSSGDRV